MDTILEFSVVVLAVSYGGAGWLIVPVYNERQTPGAILGAVAQSLPNVSKEVVIVAADRRSISMAMAILFLLKHWGSSKICIRPIYHEHNLGKGGGLQTGFVAVT
jgi:hypothetical protein